MAVSGFSGKMLSCLVMWLLCGLVYARPLDGHLADPYDQFWLSEAGQDGMAGYRAVVMAGESQGQRAVQWGSIAEDALDQQYAVKEDEQQQSGSEEEVLEDQWEEEMEDGNDYGEYEDQYHFALLHKYGFPGGFEDSDPSSLVRKVKLEKGEELEAEWEISEMEMVTDESVQVKVAAPSFPVEIVPSEMQPVQLEGEESEGSEVGEESDTSPVQLKYMSSEGPEEEMGEGSEESKLEEVEEEEEEGLKYTEDSEQEEGPDEGLEGPEGDEFETLPVQLKYMELEEQVEKELEEHVEIKNMEELAEASSLPGDFDLDSYQKDGGAQHRQEITEWTKMSVELPVQ
ncbi:uncharacterized protein LOC136751818 [Amia ocellicauda]|uniref:uncharacterized protein LOC136751818 n=1 Tax=Amia ocellicauda TaxID=2972642 RepID=UPI003464AF6B